MRQKIGFRHFNALKFSFKFCSSHAQKADYESVQKSLQLVSEWVVTSCQELPYPASSYSCCLSRAYIQLYTLLDSHQLLAMNQFQLVFI